MIVDEILIYISSHWREEAIFFVEVFMCLAEINITGTVDFL